METENFTKGLNAEKVTTLVQESRKSKAPKTLRTSATLFTAAADVGDRLTSVYSKDNDWFHVIVELGMEKASLTLDQSPVGYMRCIVRLGEHPKDDLKLSVSEAVVVVLDRACKALTDFWNDSFKAEGLNSDASYDRLFWDAINCNAVDVEFGHILRVAGPDSAEIDRYLGMEGWQG